MPITYTNRKGVTYYLCRGTTKTGKPRYYFAREPKAEPVEEIPQGWEIRESVNGVVSLAKKRPRQILPEEVSAFEEAVKRHPKSHNYRVDAKGNQIIIYERVGPDADELLGIFEKGGVPMMTGAGDRLREMMERDARFTPVLRFTLRDKNDRTFDVERMSYSGEGGWRDVHRHGRSEKLAREIVPTLDTDAFFELEIP
jgi:hypothetical protein